MAYYIGETSCVPLWRYADILGLDECGLYGVRYDGQEQTGCGVVWTLAQRRMLRRYLAEAQYEIEAVLGYHLCPTWTAEEATRWRARVLTRWGYLIEIGVPSTTILASGAAVSYLTDPPTIGPIATTVTDVTSIAVLYPGTNIPIDVDPQDISIAGGFLTITVPRCRLVDIALATSQPENGFELTDAANFTATVDVVSVSGDDTSAIMGVWPRGKSGCGAQETEALNYRVRLPDVGSLDVWLASGCVCRMLPATVSISYRSGLPAITLQGEDTVIRLAHAKMPNAPCGCEPASVAWARDRAQPEFVDAYRGACPFGPQDGALTAYRFAFAQRLVRAAVL